MARIELLKFKSDLTATLISLAKTGHPVAARSVIDAYRKKHRKGLSTEARRVLEEFGMLKVLSQIVNRVPVRDGGELDLFGDRKGLHQCITVPVLINGRQELQYKLLLEATVGELGEWTLRKPRPRTPRSQRELEMVAFHRDLAKLASADTLVSEALKLMKPVKSGNKTKDLN